MRSHFVAFGLLAASLALGQSYLGRVDTIGGTTHEWQTNGNGARRLVNMPGQGVYVLWMYSASSSTSYPDRNMRCNYYDFAGRAWTWLDPDFMRSGVDVFPVRTGYGNLAALADGSEAYASAHLSATSLRPAVAGLSSDSMTLGPDAYSYPVIAAGTDSAIHVAMYGYPDNDTVYYCRVWDSVVALGTCGYPTHNIAASKTSGEVVVTWVETDDPGFEYPAYYRRSSDGGRTWGSLTLVEPPPAFGPDSVVSFSPYGVFPYFGSDDGIRLAVSVSPVVGGTYRPEVTELWHWCPDNTPQWSEVHRAGCAPEHMMGGVGYNAGYAGRPSLGEDDEGNLYVAWEQFDSSNVEPSTGLLRAGIWVAFSSDQGGTWQPGRLITARTTTSYRYPCIADWQIECGSGPDTVVITYESDSVAGFWMFGFGPCTSNPMICHFWTTGDTATVGVEESGQPTAYSLQPTATVLTASGVRRLASSVIFDATGRRVASPKSGVFFVRAASGKLSAVGCQKVVVTR